MIKDIKKRIKAFISAEVERSVLKNIPVASTPSQPIWNNMVAINPDYKEFQPLQDVSFYRDGKTAIDPNSIDLEFDLDRYIEKDTYPLPSTEDREGYMDDRHFEFWLFGLSDYIKIKKSIEKYGHQMGPGYRAYEMGCATGRVIRHFLCQEKGLDLWASDINSNHADWLSKYLKGVKAFQNHSLPHLPFEDRFFDLVYAFSVFTHIDAFDTAWLMELHRIMKKGGIAYLTTHSEHTWSIMDENTPIYHAMLSHPDFNPEMLKSEMPHQKLIYHWNSGCYGANVFYHTDYIVNVWGSYFEILDIVKEGCLCQEVIILRKKE